DITSALSQSQVNKTNLNGKPEKQPNPERLSFLTPDQYLIDRIQDQVDYFAYKTGKLARQLTAMQVAIYVMAGAGTFVAALGGHVWVAFTTAIVTALTTKLQADQIENSLVQYNQALTSLRNIESWWKALSVWEKQRPKNIDLLVEQSEKVLELETAGWVQQM